MNMVVPDASNWSGDDKAEFNPYLTEQNLINNKVSNCWCTNGIC